MSKDISFLTGHENAIRDKRILLRLDLNLTGDPMQIFSNYRMQLAINTIEKLLQYTDSITIISHMSNENTSLIEVFKILKGRFPRLEFIEKESYFDDRARGLYLMENIRFFEEELTNDQVFAKKLSNLGDVFVQDAFAVLHRQHASVVSLPKFMPSYAGYIVERELQYLELAQNPPESSMFVLGGAKFETKMELIERMLAKYDCLFITGALANDFIKSKGFNVGRSKVSNMDVQQDLLLNEKVILPEAFIVFDTKEGRSRLSDGTDIQDTEKIVDAFMPEENCTEKDFILWNGPFGWYERDYLQGSCRFIKRINGRAIAGGGDTISVINKCGGADKFEYISTAGGAMLIYLLHGTLPGIEALI